MKKKYIYALSLITIAFIITVTLSINLTKNSGVCIGGGSCDIVEQSKYSSILGVPIFAIGLVILFIFSLLLIITYYNENSKLKTFTNLFSAVILFGSIYFIVIQAIVIKAICRYCILIDTLSLAASIIILFYNEKRKETNKERIEEN